MRASGGNQNLVGNRFIQRSDGVLKSFTAQINGANKYDTFKDNTGTQVAVPAGKKWIILSVGGLAVHATSVQFYGVGYASIAASDTATFPTGGVINAQPFTVLGYNSLVQPIEMTQEIPATKYPFICGGNLAGLNCHFNITVLEVPA